MELWYVWMLACGGSVWPSAKACSAQVEGCSTHVLQVQPKDGQTGARQTTTVVELEPVKDNHAKASRRTVEPKLAQPSYKRRSY